jgi:hypothetical protein
VLPIAQEFNKNVAANKQKFVDSSTNIRNSLRDKLKYNVTALKTARDALSATIAKFPFIRVSDPSKSTLLRILYTTFVTNADEALNYVQSINTYILERGAIRHFDGNITNPIPADALLKTFCGDFQNVLWNYEDAYREDKDCAAREIAKVASPVTFYQQYTPIMPDVEAETQKNIAANYEVYKKTVDAAIAYLTLENARLSKCAANTNTCVDQLVSRS